MNFDNHLEVKTPGHWYRDSEESVAGVSLYWTHSLRYSTMCDVYALEN